MLAVTNFKGSITRVKLSTIPQIYNICKTTVYEQNITIDVADIVVRP
jgi:hypothetical protein